MRCGASAAPCAVKLLACAPTGCAPPAAMTRLLPCAARLAPVSAAEARTPASSRDGGEGSAARSSACRRGDGDMPRGGVASCCGDRDIGEPRAEHALPSGDGGDRAGVCAGNAGPGDLAGDAGARAARCVGDLRRGGVGERRGDDAPRGEMRRCGDVRRGGVGDGRWGCEGGRCGGGVGEATRDVADAPPTDSVSVSSPSAVSDRSPWLAPSDSSCVCVCVCVCVLVCVCVCVYSSLCVCACERASEGMRRGQPGRQESSQGRHRCPRTQPRMLLPTLPPPCTHSPRNRNRSPRCRCRSDCHRPPTLPCSPPHWATRQSACLSRAQGARSSL